MKSLSLSARLIAPVILLSTLVTLVLSLVVFSEVYSRYVDRQKQYFSQYVALKAATENRPFELLYRRDLTAREDLLKLASQIDDRRAVTEFDRLFPLQPDGTRRSADFLFNGGRTANNERVSGIGAFISNGAHVSLQDKKYLVAAVDVVFDYGRTGAPLMVDNFYFFTPDNRLVIYGPHRPDKLIFYRKTAPAGLSLSKEQISRITLPEINPQRVIRCTGLQRIVYDTTGRRLMTACVTPIDVGGVHVGAVGSSAPMDGFVRGIIDRPLPGAYNVIIGRDGGLIAHPGLAVPGEVTNTEKQKYERELGLSALAKTIRQRGVSNGVIDTPDGKNIVAYGRIDGPGWYFMMVSSKRDMSIAAMRSAADIFVLAAIAVAVQAAALFWMLKRIVVQPIETLARHSRAPLEDAAEARNVERRTDEIGELARSLSFERSRGQEILQNLEERVQDRTRQLKAANEEKSRFLANMSHELRTPLNGVIAVADLLYRLQSEERGREYADIIRSSAVTLERVVSDVLDFSKIEAGQVEFDNKPFVIRSLVEGVAKPFAVSAAAKAVKLQVQLAPELAESYSGDAHRISQVLNNLISNAVKFTDVGHVSVFVAETDGCVVFTVADTGVGFPPEVRDRLFARFVQADSSITRRFGGSGLGLSICAALVRLMNGHIDATSTPGVGSTFVVMLPLTACATVGDTSPAVSHSSSHPDHDHQRLTVMLAEDNPTNQRVVQLILEAADVDLVIVENGRDAIARFQQMRFDCILMDMQMPEVDGLQAIRAIRKIEWETGRDRTPIICVSANALTEHVAASRLAGADRHLAKPFRPQALLDALACELAAGEAGGAADMPMAVGSLAAGGPSV